MSQSLETLVVTASEFHATFATRRETHFFRRRRRHPKGRALYRIVQEEKEEEEKREVKAERKKMVVEPEGCPQCDEIVSVIRRKLARSGVPRRGRRGPTCCSSWSSRVLRVLVNTRSSATRVAPCSLAATRK